jgi:SAM-dependent methyltransferase
VVQLPVAAALGAEAGLGAAPERGIADDALVCQGIINAQGQKPTGLLGWVVATVMGGLFVPVNARVGRLLDPRPDDSVLDVACGAGEFLRWHARHATRVAGLDHSAIQIRVARRLLHRRVMQGTAEVVLGDATALPWADGQFSAAACNCLDCIAQPRTALAEMHRVLRPGGRVVIGIDRFDDPARARHSTHKRGLPAWTEAELITLMSQAGFEDVAISRGAGRTYALASRR